MESLGPLVCRLIHHIALRPSVFCFTSLITLGPSSPNPVHFLSLFLLFLLFLLSLLLFLISFHLTPAEQTSRLFTRFLPALSYTLAVSSLQRRVFRELIVFFHLNCTSYCLAIDRQEPVSDQIDEYLQLANPELPTRILNNQQPTTKNQHAYRDPTLRTHKPPRF